MLNVRLRFLMELLFYVPMETQTRRQNLYLYLLSISICLYQRQFFLFKVDAKFFGYLGLNIPGEKPF